MTRFFSYSRVSTEEQTTDNQLLEIEAAGFTVEAHRAIVECISGKTSAMSRPMFTMLLNKLETGDTLIVTKLDRLGRDTVDVLATVATLEASGVRVYCLALGGMDLTSPAGKMTMTVLAAVAQFERDLLIERTHAGLERAKAAGVKLGRKVAYTQEQADAVKKDIQENKLSIREAARVHGVTASAVQRMLASK
ncbi:recombinase family protein [Janthinobacterium sp. B9-8]|uniref:recombinase family protein n=1 Tax=Janthinobacterium sp. B9-8 TaxID=1236179 RepID=UPI00061D32B8|nr:recombinase family protein [Janthinobacterium sp. B9-8]AMC37068.1 hypothetical protein VN23_11725 [Janthinobacterium sp. B9-8]